VELFRYLGGAGGGAQGGGLYANGGSLTVASSTIASNQGAGGSAGRNGDHQVSGLGYGGGIYNLGTLTVSNNTLSGNSASSSYTSGYVGLPGGGGGIYNSGTLTVSNSTLSGNSTSGPRSNGGGIYNLGTLTVSNNTLSGNSASSSYPSGYDGGPGGGGGIFNGGTLTVNNSTLSGNSANLGGGIFNDGYYSRSATLTVSNSILSGNSAYGYVGFAAGGGGIYNSGTLTVSNSSLSGNFAYRDGDYSFSEGGGIYNEGRLTVSNSTLSGNSAYSDGDHSFSYGGGIDSDAGFSPVTLTNVTLTANRVSGLGSHGGGLYVGTNGSPVLHNTLIAGNFNGATGTTGDDVYGRLDPSGDYNLIGDGTGMSGLTNGVNGNQIGSASDPIDPLLGPLQDNGGPTLTHALLPGSPAIDAGNNAYATEWDQRGPGFRRIVNGTIDIGAFEVQAHAHGRPTGQPLPDPLPAPSSPAPNALGPEFSISVDLPQGPAQGPGATDRALLIPEASAAGRVSWEDRSVAPFPEEADGQGAIHGTDLEPVRSAGPPPPVSLEEAGLV
jgi:hypothetical protein